MKNINGKFYEGEFRVPPTGRKPLDMNKSFYTEEAPGVRTLAKGGNFGGPDPIQVLDYHMRKATKDKKKGLDEV